MPFSETGAKDGFNPPSSGCTRRSMKKADVLLGDSSVILWMKWIKFDDKGEGAVERGFAADHQITISTNEANYDRGVISNLN